MNSAIAWVLLCCGMLLTPWFVLCLVYAFLIQHSFMASGLALPLRQAAWLSVTDIMEWLRIIERPPAHVHGPGERGTGGEPVGPRVRTPRGGRRPLKSADSAADTPTAVRPSRGP